MTLDITKIASEIGSMVSKIRSGNREQREHLDNALVKINDRAIDLAKLTKKIKAGGYPWPAARLCSEELGLHQAAPVFPEEYTVLATDGSHIAVDRHQAVRCFLINTGTVRIRYGQNPSADLDSTPGLYSEENDLVIKEEKNKQRVQQIEGALLDARRSVEEVRKLAEMADRQTEKGPVLALLDGSLVLFGLESFPDYVLEYLLERGFFKALDGLEKLSRSLPLSLASYISLPRSTEVTNVLKLAICPQEKAECERLCAEGSSACDIISGINDRLLFAELLAPGERSALFINSSHILERYGKHKVYFFYLRAEEEIARVEVPEWVAVRKDLVDMTHALVLDQCRRGQGYPVALSEAHEQAVVTAADRQEFWNLVEESLADEKMPVYTSIKSRSKRTRWI
jgi:hypothetical protein